MGARYTRGMENTGKSETVKKPGAGLMNAGLFIAGIGLVLLIAVMGSGGMPTLLVWALPIVGLVLAAVGYSKRSTR